MGGPPQDNRLRAPKKHGTLTAVSADICVLAPKDLRKTPLVGVFRTRGARIVAYCHSNKKCYPFYIASYSAADGGTHIRSSWSSHPSVAEWRECTMLEKHESFRTLTTLKVGGDIKRVERVASRRDCLALVAELDSKKDPLLILGGGSNVLASDSVYEGTVVIPSFSSFLFEEIASSKVRVVVDAGVVWDTLVEESVARGLWGIENLSSIPGSVGAAPMQNIGAYGTDVSKTIEWVDVYDRIEKAEKQLRVSDLSFGYRTSVLKKERGRYVVLRVSFLLSKHAAPNISYKDLAVLFEGNSAPALPEIRDAVIKIRKGKFPSLAEYGTAGSFFLNPVVSQEIALTFLKHYPNASYFQAKDRVKLSLAWMLDSIIHAKGMRVGGAFVWDKQPLVIATNNNATGNDVRMLMKTVQEKVFHATHIAIEPEVFVM